MLKSLKMTVAEDAITTEEVLVADLVAEEVLLQEEKVVLLQEEKVLADLEATEIRLLEKAVSDLIEIQLLQEEKAVFHLTELRETVHQKEPQDVLKALVILQDQEDQEETNTISNSNINLPNLREIFFYNISSLTKKHPYLV